jgi:hypothetical protein
VSLDFDALVLKPAMDVFSKSMIVKPLASQPFAPHYTARGVWSKRPVDIATEGGGILSSEERKIGIRVSEFAVPVAPLDQVKFDGEWYWVDDVDEDGQGGASLTLKAANP